MTNKTLPAGVDVEALAQSGLVTDADLIQLMQEGEKAPEPGVNTTAGLLPQQLIHRGDDEVPVPMMLKVLASAGYSRIYDRKTGEVSLTNNNMLPTQMKKRGEDGALVFSLRKPAGVTPVRGTLRCRLHADRRTPDYDAMGLPTCRKSNLTSEYQVRLHMEHRHQSAWKTLEEQRERTEREQDRAVQLKILELAGAQAGAKVAERSPEEVEAMRERMAKARAARGQKDAA